MSLELASAIQFTIFFLLEVKNKNKESYEKECILILFDATE